MRNTLRDFRLAEYSQLEDGLSAAELFDIDTLLSERRDIFSMALPEFFLRKWWINAEYYNEVLQGETKHSGLQSNLAIAFKSNREAAYFSLLVGYTLLTLSIMPIVLFTSLLADGVRNIALSSFHFSNYFPMRHSCYHSKNDFNKLKHHAKGAGIALAAAVMTTVATPIVVAIAAVSLTLFVALRLSSTVISKATSVIGGINRASLSAWLSSFLGNIQIMSRKFFVPKHNDTVEISPECNRKSTQHRFIVAIEKNYGRNEMQADRFGYIDKRRRNAILKRDIRNEVYSPSLFCRRKNLSSISHDFRGCLDSVPEVSLWQTAVIG